MRNLFDQYTHPENRLTHALLSSLANDRTLLRRFVRWVTGKPLPKGALDVLEQSLPGEPLGCSEEEAEQRGLPDACIHVGDEWALLIESKFAARPTSDQLRRHLRTARRKGLSNVSLLLLTVHRFAGRLPEGVRALPWSDVYSWLGREGRRSPWARHCVDYLEIAEAKESGSEYLKNGKLTEFTGIPFGAGQAYNYVQARRLIKLLREELCKEKRLARNLGADLAAPGRSAITGRDGKAVWDFIPLRPSRRAKNFTEYPHLTFAIHDDLVEALITVPNGIQSRLRAKLLGSDSREFASLIEEVTERLMRGLRQSPGFTPRVIILQRHYRTQRSSATIDCKLNFDARTALPRGHRMLGSVKPQPQWLDAAFAALISRRSNLQFQVGAYFPYAGCSTVHSKDIVRAIGDAWIACKPIIDGATD